MTKSGRAKKRKVKLMSNVIKELCEIGRLIDSANLLTAVRKEVHSLFEHRDAIVVGGKQAKDSQGYDIIVRLGFQKDSDAVVRRLKANVPGVEVNKLVENVLGIKHVRRGRIK